MSITRDEIRVLCAEHDRLMAAAAEERRIYADGRFRSGSPPEPLADGADVIYRQHDNSASAPAAAADVGDWSGWDRWLRGHLDIERRGLLDALEKDLVEVLDEERRVTRQESEAELLKVRAEVAELRGRVDTLLSLLQTKGPVVDLPRAGWRRDGAA